MWFAGSRCLAGKPLLIAYVDGRLCQRTVGLSLPGQTLHESGMSEANGVTMFTVSFHTTALAALLAAGVFAISVPSSAATPAVAIDTETNVSEFTYLVSRAEHAAAPLGRYPDTVLTVPIVYIFSPSGDLIYRETGDDRVDHDSANERYRAMLQGLPKSAEHLSPIKNMPTLKAMLDFIPAYKEKEQAIIEDGHYVVYAVIPKVDRVTSTQKAVLALRDRAEGLPVDTLMLRIQY